MRFWYSNNIDSASVAITASSAPDALPPSNVAHEFRSRKWRTLGTVAAEWIVFDLVSAVAATSVIILDHDLTAGDSLIKIEAHTSNSWGSPAFSQTLTYAAGTISATFASQSYRWWRVSFTKSASSEIRNIGRIYIGTYYDTTEQPDYDGFTETTEDLTTIQTSRGGQTYADQRSQFKMLSVDFSRVNNTQAAQLLTIFEAVGQFRSFYVQIETTPALTKIWYVKRTDKHKRKVSGFDSSYLWDFKLEFSEQL